MTRDSLIWTVGFVGSVLLFIVAHTQLVPPPYVATVRDIAMVIGFVSGKLGWSPLPASAAAAADPPTFR